MFVYIFLITLMAALASPIYAADPTPKITIGTQEVGLSAGYMFSHLLKKSSESEQSGPALMPFWMMTITDPVGNGWYRGQVSIGAEAVYIRFVEPVTTHGIGFAPRIKYTFVTLNRIRPYVEFAGGPFWTDLAGKIPEQHSEFNFVLMAGLGVSYFMTDQAALNAGYLFQHISNAHTSTPNVGLNSSLPYVGFSFYY